MMTAPVAARARLACTPPARHVWYCTEPVLPPPADARCLCGAQTWDPAAATDATAIPSEPA